ERQAGFTERHRGRTRGARLLVGNLRALLDQRLDLVGGEHARAGDDLALAVGLERRELQVEEAREGAIHQDEREVARREAVETGRRHVDAQAVRDEDRRAALCPAAGVAADIAEAAAGGEPRAAADWTATGQVVVAE